VDDLGYADEVYVKEIGLEKMSVLPNDLALISKALLSIATRISLQYLPSSFVQAQRIL